MCLVDESAIICDSLGLESTELESRVGRVLQDHVGASSRSSRILEVLAHERVSTTGVSGVHDSHLFLRVASCVACLGSEEKLLLAFISIEVLGAEQIEKGVHLHEAVGIIDDLVSTVQHVTRPLVCQVLREGLKAVIDAAG